MAKPTPASGGFQPIEVPVRDQTALPGFKPFSVGVPEAARPRAARSAQKRPDRPVTQPAKPAPTPVSPAPTEPALPEKEA